jgi:hypothetical protein
MEKKIKRVLEKKISSNITAVFLVIAIIISAVGTYIILYNSYTPDIIKGEPMTTAGEVGIYVENPNIPEQGGINETD